MRPDHVPVTIEAYAKSGRLAAIMQLVDSYNPQSYVGDPTDRFDMIVVDNAMNDAILMARAVGLTKFIDMLKWRGVAG